MIGVPRIGLYSDSAIVGGAERSLINLVNTYRGGAELVVCGTNPEFLEEVRALVPAATSHHIRNQGSVLTAIRNHRRAFRTLELNLLQVTLCNPFAARPAMLAAFSARIPVVAVEQLVLPSRRRRGRILKNLLSRPLAGHVAVGTRSADDLRRFFGIRRSSVTVVHNGVPPSVAPPVDFDRRPVIGCAARLEDQKALHVLIDALAGLPAARLVLVGDGERRSDLEQQARDRGVADRVEFAGWQTDACPYIAGFDVFALPSRDESFPLTIVEAMLASTPVVASDVGSVADAITDGVTGLLVPAGDAGALRDALARMLEDHMLRQAMTEAALDRAREHFTAATMASSYDALWKSVLA